jgi:hypothetical protein
MFKRLILTALVAAFALAGVVSAATFTWQGDNSQAWNDPNNWDIGVGLPTNGAGGDVVLINATVLPNRDPNVVVQGALYQQMYIQNNGVLNVSAGDTTNYGILGSGSSYNNVNDGIWNIQAGGTSNMSQNLYIGHTDTAGSQAYMNIYSGGLMRTGGVLTFGGRRGNGEMNIYGGGIYNLFNNIRWEHLPVGGMVYTSKLRIYKGGVWNWSLDRVSTDEVGWAVRTNRVVAGDVGYEILAVYDSVANSTAITTTRYMRAYLPTYVPALINNSANTNTAALYAASGTIDLGWTNPEPSNPSMPVTSDVYFGLAGGALTQIAAGITANTVTGVAINKLNNYEWRIDSHDPNMEAAHLLDPNKPEGLTTGDVWSFNTQNIAPIASAETSPQRIWLVSSAASLTLNATATDDGYPLPSPTLTYTWSQTPAGAVDILPSPVVAQNVTLNFTSAVGTLPQTRTFQVVCGDGALDGPAYAVEVRIYANGCLAGQNATGVTVGDINSTSDCMVNFKDFARLAGDWMKCKTTDGICPL